MDRFECFLYQEVHEIKEHYIKVLTFIFILQINYIHLVKNNLFFTVLFLIPKGVAIHVHHPGKVISIAPVISI